MAAVDPACSEVYSARAARRGVVVRVNALVLCLMCLGAALCQRLEAQEAVVIDRDLLGRGVVLDTGWTYRPVALEDLRAGSIRLDDDRGDREGRGEPIANTRLSRAAMPERWTGAGWFVLELDVTNDVVGEELALSLNRHFGASRVLLDGQQQAEIGEVGVDRASFEPRLRSDPIIFSFDRPGRHRLQVLFVNPDVERYHRAGYAAGFVPLFEGAGAAITRVRTRERDFASRRALFPSIYVSFALLHFLLYLFRRRSIENLYFALFCCSLATLAFLLVHKELVRDPRIIFWSESMMNLAGLGFAASGVLFVHRVFRPDQATGWILRLALFGLLLFAPFAATAPGITVMGVFIAMLLGVLEMARCVLMAVIRGRGGARIVGVGVLVLAVGFTAGLLGNLGILPRVTAYTFYAPFLSMMLLIVTMSIYLSRRHALTQTELEEQLVKVRTLSEERLAQEKRERAQELQNRLLEAEVARRDEELEEARRLQLSMLPQTLPEVPGIEIAAHMTTATEVGGDYYDFDVGDGESLTVAVGDATGHGLRAGMMVTATKSLFNALGAERDLVGIVGRANAALKRMRLRNLNMALLLARLDGSSLRVAAAGMPEPQVYRAQRDVVESLEVGGMPLGAMSSFPYRTVETELGEGDVVLMMSDGFPERTNASGEQLGYEAAMAAFRDAARGSAVEIVERLTSVGEQWSQGTPADDDVTFVVLKKASVSGEADDA